MYIYDIKTTLTISLDVISQNDYFPFGMQMPGRNGTISGGEYRYAFNGMETDKEVSTDGNGQNSYTTQFRQYDPRLGRWKSLDPLMHQFIGISPFVSFDNNPINYIDPLGLAAEGGPGDGERKEASKSSNTGISDSDSLSRGEGDIDTARDIIIYEPFVVSGDLPVVKDVEFNPITIEVKSGVYNVTGPDDSDDNSPSFGTNAWLRSIIMVNLGTNGESSFGIVWESDDKSTQNPFAIPPPKLSLDGRATTENIDDWGVLVDGLDAATRLDNIKSVPKPKVEKVMGKYKFRNSKYGRSKFEKSYGKINSKKQNRKFENWAFGDDATPWNGSYGLYVKMVKSLNSAEQIRYASEVLKASGYLPIWAKIGGVAIESSWTKDYINSSSGSQTPVLSPASSESIEEGIKTIVTENLDTIIIKEAPHPLSPTGEKFFLDTLKDTRVKDY